MNYLSIALIQFLWPIAKLLLSADILLNKQDPRQRLLRRWKTTGNGSVAISRSPYDEDCHYYRHAQQY
jgi:hypothetical protein